VARCEIVASSEGDELLDEESEESEQEEEEEEESKVPESKESDESEESDEELPLDDVLLSESESESESESDVAVRRCICFRRASNAAIAAAAPPPVELGGNGMLGSGGTALCLAEALDGMRLVMGAMEPGMRGRSLGSLLDRAASSSSVGIRCMPARSMAATRAASSTA
jgi:hypothetical protein